MNGWMIKWLVNRKIPGPDSWSIWFDEFMLLVSLSAKYPEMRDQLQKGKNIKNLCYMRG